MQEFNDSNFESEVIEASKAKPVLVDFYAPWCGVCKIVGPVFAEAAEEMKDKIIAGKANIEETAVFAEKFDIMTLPTIALFKDGKLEKSINGPQAKESIAGLLA